MKLIKEDKINKKIGDGFEYSFDADRRGLYLIEIIASAKSWWQNLATSFRSILKATIAQESSFGNVVDHDRRYVGESGLMGLEKDNSIAQLAKLGYSFDYNNIQDVVRASAAYYKWLVGIELEKFEDARNPLKLYTQYRKDLKAKDTKAPGIKEFLYYYFYYKQ